MPKIKTLSGDNLPTSDGTKSNYPQTVSQPTGKKSYSTDVHRGLISKPDKKIARSILSQLGRGPRIKDGWRCKTYFKSSVS